jgi:hypothetical protein
LLRVMKRIIHQRLYQDTIIIKKKERNRIMLSVKPIF